MSLDKLKEWWSHLSYGLCFDDIKLFDWMESNDYYRYFYFFLRYRVSPGILIDILNAEVDLEERGRLFALGTSALRIGKIFKTTALKRTNIAENLLLKCMPDVQEPSLMEIGVSDGSSALGHFADGRFKRVVLTDRFSRFYLRKIPFGAIYLDAERRYYCLKFVCFYKLLDLKPGGKKQGDEVLEVVNPILREKYGVNAIKKFNMFEDVIDEPVGVVKCSNILNKAYFSDDMIRDAVTGISKSLADGGIIVVSQNHEHYKDGEAAFVLKKDGDSLKVIESVNDHDIVGLFETE